MEVLLDFPLQLFWEGMDNYAVQELRQPWLVPTSTYLIRQAADETIAQTIGKQKWEVSGLISNVRSIGYMKGRLSYLGHSMDEPLKLESNDVHLLLQTSNMYKVPLRFLCKALKVCFPTTVTSPWLWLLVFNL